MSEIRRLLARLFTRPCRSCAAPVGRYADLCEACAGRLPVAERWAFQEAREWRLLHPATYRTALYGPHGDDGVLAWLAANPKSNAETTTTRTKERS